MEYKIVIPPTGEKYTSTDLNSVRAFFMREYKKLARHDNIDRDTVLTADVLVYTPDYVLSYCQFEGQEEKTENHYAPIGAMVWATPEVCEDYCGLDPGAYWCDYSDTGGEITYARKVSVSGVVKYNTDYDVRFT